MYHLKNQTSLLSELLWFGNSAESVANDPTKSLPMKKKACMVSQMGFISLALFLGQECERG